MNHVSVTSLRHKTRIGWLSALAALTLAACAQPTTWVRAGGTATEMKADLSACRNQTDRLLSREMATDAAIAASREADWQREGLYRSRRAAMADSLRGRHDALVTDCMTSRGWTRATR